jgi:hypothetical protein
LAGKRQAKNYKALPAIEDLLKGTRKAVLVLDAQTNQAIQTLLMHEPVMLLRDIHQF